MEMPKVQRRYCKFCRKHTEQTVRREKATKQRRTLAWTERQKKRAKKGYGNPGKFGKKPAGQKPTTRVDLRVTAENFDEFRHVFSSFRVKRFELVG